MAQNTKVRKRVRIPFFPEDSQRGFLNANYGKDSKFYNCYVKVRENPILNSKVPYLVRRPGVQAYDIFDGSDTNYGVWVFGDKLYTIVDDGLYVENQPGASLGFSLVFSFYAKTLREVVDYDISFDFGTSFYYDYAYRGTEIINDGIEQLYITNGYDHVFISKDGSVTRGSQSFNRFSANGYYKPGDKIISTSTTSPGYFYIAIGDAGEVSQAGTEPTWPTLLGSTVTTGDVTFLCISSASIQDVARIHTVSTSYIVGDLIQPSTESGLYYQCTVAGTTSGTEPTSWTQIKGDTTTDGTVTWECLGYYGGKPGLALPSPVYLDTYLVLTPYGSSDLYNSDPEDPYSWKATNFISANSFTSKITAISRYNNYIIVFSNRDAELFFNNANTDGSPLSRHESFLLQIGVESQFTLTSSESLLAWVGLSTSGKNTIWILDGFEPKEISNPWISSLISLPGNTWTSNVSSISLRIDGHLFFVFNFLYNTVVFDVKQATWYNWSIMFLDNYAQEPLSLSSFAFYSNTSNSYAFVTKNKFENDPTLYEISKEFLMDSLVPITDVSADGIPIIMEIVTPPIDLDNRKRKFLHSLDIIGDLLDEDEVGEFPDYEYNTNAIVTWSDKDFKDMDITDIINDTYTEAPIYEVDLRTRPRIAPCGSFRRRSFALIYKEPYSVRFEALELSFTEGNH
jgi:hypothetical protein